MNTEPITRPARTTSARKQARNASGDKRSQIVDKAIELFNRVGYERVKISDITDSLGIAKGTLYLYFRNKKELLLECYRHLDSLILSLEHRNLVREVAGGFFEKTIPRFVGFQEQYTRFIGILNLIRMYSGSDDPEIRQCAVRSYRAIIEPLKPDLVLAVQLGSARKIDEELAIYALVAVADSICYRATLDDRYSAQEIREFFRDFVNAAVRPTPFEQDPEPRSSAGIITDRNGASTEVDQIKFGGETKIRGKLGLATVELDSASIASVTMLEGEAGWFADVHLRDGTHGSVRVDPDIVLSAGTPLGTLRMGLRDVSTIVFV